MGPMGSTGPTELAAEGVDPVAGRTGTILAVAAIDGVAEAEAEVQGGARERRARRAPMAEPR
jgi:serine/threonine protein kinase HipA of HipAB toxin-antitoxin module